jgi:hypothetical protein
MYRRALLKGTALFASVFAFPTVTEASDDEETTAEAFEALARQYEGAVEECRQMAAASRRVPEMEVRADTHHIEVEAPSNPVIDKLVEDGVLQESQIGADEFAD